MELTSGHLRGLWTALCGSACVADGPLLTRTDAKKVEHGRWGWVGREKKTQKIFPEHQPSRQVGFVCMYLAIRPLWDQDVGSPAGLDRRASAFGICTRPCT